MGKLNRICFVTSKEPFEYTISILSGKWKLRILYVLACMGTVRYGELKRNIDGITHKMLSAQLKELGKEGIILRHEYPQVPPKVDYTLSDKGTSLVPIIRALCDWGEMHVPQRSGL